MCELWGFFFFDPRVSKLTLARRTLAKLIYRQSAEECKIQPGKEEQWDVIQGSSAFVLPQKMPQAVMGRNVLRSW